MLTTLQPLQALRQAWDGVVDAAIKRVTLRDPKPSALPPEISASFVAHPHTLPMAQQAAAVYQQSTWVYLAIKYIAEAGALVGLRVRSRAADAALRGVHPLERLLDAPNPFVSRFELLEQTLGALELTGNAFWYLAAGPDGRPAQIWPLRPDRVSIVPHKTEFVHGYIYEVDGTRVPLDVAEVIHFKRWHPSNEYYGASPLEVLRLAIHGDRAMAEWNRNTFARDHAVPAGIVTIKEQISDADFDRLKEDWRSNYGGTQRRTAFLRGGTLTWQNVGLSHTELDFLRGRQAYRDEILSVFGVPLGLISENATEANATVAERQFVERTLYPKLVRIAQKITQELLPFWADAGYADCVAEFDDIRPTRLDDLRAAYPLLSINELRARYYKLGAVDWGDLPANHRAAAKPAPQTPPPPAAVPSPVATPAPIVGPAAPAAAPSDADANDDEDIAQLGADADTTTPPQPHARKMAVDLDEAAEYLHDMTHKTPQAELVAWERFIIKRMAHGKTAARGRAFVVRHLPSGMAAQIRGELAQAHTVQQARAVFNEARAVLMAMQAMGDMEGEDAPN
jgi:HK97 family phage portal protein